MQSNFITDDTEALAAEANEALTKRVTELAEESTPAAILHVLNLNRKAVGIGEIELGSSSFCTAAIRHAKGDIGHER